MIEIVFLYIVLAYYGHWWVFIPIIGLNIIQFVLSRHNRQV